MLRRPPPNNRAQKPRGFSYPYFSIVNCSGSSTGAPNVDVDLGAGGGAAFGLGTAIARGGVALARTSGVSDGLGEVFFFGVGDFSPVAFFFFFGFGEVSFAGDFLAFGFGVAFGVSLGVGDTSDSSAGVFLAFAFGFGAGEVDFFFLCGEVFGFGVGVGESSVTARAFRTRGDFSSSGDCAWRTKPPTTALSARKVGKQTRKRTTAAQRNRVLRPINRQRNQNSVNYAGCIADSDASGLPRLSRSRRRIAFNLPPRSKNKQVRYIHVSRMMIDASAR